jgi:hypothetical protein
MGGEAGAPDEVILFSGHPFSNDQVVIYYAPVDHTFTGGVVEIPINFGNGVPTTNPEGLAPAPDGSNTIWLGKVDNGGNVTPHGYNTGDEVVYSVDIGGSPIGLSDGVHYFVIKPAGDNYRIQLATTFCRAVGAAAQHPSCIIGGDGSAGNPFVYQPRVIIDISRPTGASLGTSHTLVLASRGPIGGLKHRGVYFVVNATANNFQLSLTQGGGAINLTDSGGNGHVFRREGLNITSAGTCPSTSPGCKKLVLDLTNGSGGLFEGVGGAASFAVPTSGDGVVTASTTGASGGFIDVGSPDAVATVTSTSITVSQAPVVREHRHRTDSRINVKAVGRATGSGSWRSRRRRPRRPRRTTRSRSGGAVITALADLTITGGVTNGVSRRRLRTRPASASRGLLGRDRVAPERRQRRRSAHGRRRPHGPRERSDQGLREGLRRRRRIRRRRRRQRRR